MVKTSIQWSGQTKNTSIFILNRLVKYFSNTGQYNIYNALITLIQFMAEMTSFT